MGQAGKKLVVLEVDSLQVCETGLTEESELQWKEEKQEALKPCQELKHLLQRTARDCPDVHFVHLDVSVQSCLQWARPDASNRTAGSALTDLGFSV